MRCFPFLITPPVAERLLGSLRKTLSEGTSLHISPISLVHIICHRKQHTTPTPFYKRKIKNRTENSLIFSS